MLIWAKLDTCFGLNLPADAIYTHGVEHDTGVLPENPFTFLIQHESICSTD